MALKYVHHHFPLQEHPNFTLIGLKICHLATLMQGPKMALSNMEENETCAHYCE
jgi:hypothetical protein